MESIAIIDDDRSFAQALSLFLDSLGYEARVSYEGRNGASLLGAEEINLAIVDVNLPDACGIDLVRAARDDRPELPVIMISGNQTIDDAEACLTAGANLFIGKPVEPERLVRAVRNLLDSPSAGD